MNTIDLATSRRTGSAKTWVLIGLICLLAILVPVGLYFISSIQFTNGTTSQNLSAPDTGVTPAYVAPANNGGAARNQTQDLNAVAGGKRMDLLVVDQTSKQPIAGMAVQAFGRTRFNGTTGADGHVHVPVPAGQVNNNFGIRVTGKGYVPERLQWANYRPELQGAVPTTYTMQMGKTTKISGRIIDDEGQPVGGATIALEFSMKSSDPHVQLDINGYNRDKPLKTGDDGTWVFNGAPENCEEIKLMSWDNHHVVDDYWIAQPFNPVSKLYDGTATFTLHHGVTVEGTVVDSGGAPIAGATATSGQNADIYNGIPPEKTDASGKFSYVFAPGHHVIMTVNAKGFAPDMQEVTVGSEKQSMTFTLAKPHILRGKVVNSAGNPVRNARFYLQQWRGHQTINANFQSDSSGNFRWNNAPGDAMTFSVNAPNLRGLDNVVLTPDTDNVVKLGSAVHVRGTVTDAITGKPIENLHLIFGIQFNAGDSNINWQPQWNQDMGLKPGGKIDFTDDYSYPGIAIKIEAPGYMPVESKVIKAEDGDATLDLKMKPGKDIVVTVRLSDGSPVAEAMVVMALPGQAMFIQNSRLPQNSMMPRQTTGADGKIDFPPQVGAFKIAVFADAGYGEADQDALAKSPEIKLTPWGRIEGKLTVGSKPGAGETLEITSQNNMGYSQETPQIMNQISVPADSDGHFVADRVTPGSWSINRRIPFGNNGWTYAPLATVEVASGQTVTANVGGMGRPIVGKVIIPPELVGLANTNYGSCDIETRRVPDASMMPPIPDDVKKMDPPQQRAWMQQWMKTDAGKLFLQKMQKIQANQRRYPFVIGPDGSFRVDDVEAGEYELVVDLRNLDQSQRQVSEVGIASADITVPEMPGGRSDEPLQIDPVTVTKLTKYKVGDEIYDFPMKSSDGKAAKLSDFRGKYVLLNFRQVANWSLPALKQIYDAYGPDRLTILTLNFGYGWFGQMQSSTGVRWQQATITPNRMISSILSTGLGMNGATPGDCLIDPAGKIAAADLHGDAIMTAVTAALGPPGAPATQPTTAP